jgi:hypothetical protein
MRSRRPAWRGHVHTNMQESRELLEARAHLAKAEALYGTEDGLVQLQEGLDALERVMADPAAQACHTVAHNLGATYLNKYYTRIARRLDASAQIPEPELEHLFRIIRSFDDVGFELPAAARALKIEVVKRLVNCYYEGHDPHAKAALQAQLAALARDDGED